MHLLNPICAAFATQLIIPLTALTLPSRLNSPIITDDSSISVLIMPSAARIPAATGRSNPFPAFLISAGEILTIIFCGRSIIPEFLTATLTRSLASVTCAARQPLISNDGSPSPASVSTFTIHASSPASVTLYTSLYISTPPI